MAKMAATTFNTEHTNEVNMERNLAQRKSLSKSSQVFPRPKFGGKKFFRLWLQCMQLLHLSFGGLNLINEGARDTRDVGPK